MFDGDSAQIITLILYGNVFVRGQKIHIDEANHSCFKDRGFTKFVDLKKQENNQLQKIFYATDANSWLARIKEDGVYALRLLNTAIYGYPSLCSYYFLNDASSSLTKDDGTAIFIETIHRKGSDL
jgi:hypothetical protein